VLNSLLRQAARAVYSIAENRNIRVWLTPIGYLFFFGLVALLVVLSLMFDRLLQLDPMIPSSLNLYLSIPILTIGGAVYLYLTYRFIKSHGTPFPGNPPKSLIINGLYSYIRNPMLLNWFIIILGLGILFRSFSLVLVFTPIFIAINILYVKTIEEKVLEMKFGEQYLKYKCSVPMFIPRYTRKH